jgi:hypothetical protein
VFQSIIVGSLYHESGLHRALLHRCTDLVWHVPALAYVDIGAVHYMERFPYTQLPQSQGDSSLEIVAASHGILFPLCFHLSMD